MADEHHSTQRPEALAAEIRKFRATDCSMVPGLERCAASKPGLASSTQRASSLAHTHTHAQRTLELQPVQVAHLLAIHLDTVILQDPIAYPSRVSHPHIRYSRRSQHGIQHGSQHIARQHDNKPGFSIGGDGLAWS